MPARAGTGIMWCVAVRLTGGVVTARGLRGWAPGGSGTPVDAEDADLLPGTAVVIGPEDAGRGAVEAALAELAALVAAGGVEAAGAGVELGGGFRSARLAGAPGDRRDAVLAALAVLGAGGAARLGDRAGVLVTLFGPAATKPVGAAATAAVEEGRWSALRLASAASDVLGPEQLARVLALTAPDGAEPVPRGSASALADQLARVLVPFPGPRRLNLLVDLWDTVCARYAGERRRERLHATQVSPDPTGLRQRYAQWGDEMLLDCVRAYLGDDPSIAAAARWMPPGSYWHNRAVVLMYDAMAATVLIRVALAVADHGAVDGVTRCAEQIHAAAALFDPHLAGRARRLPGLPAVPAIPGCYLLDLHRALARGRALDGKGGQYVLQRTARARDYGVVVLDAVGEHLREMVRSLPALRGDFDRWARSDLRRWRGQVGYSAVRPPARWEQPVVLTRDDPLPVLAERLRDRPDTDPAGVEVAGDLLWYADLADALARLHGHDAAVVEYSEDRPFLAYQIFPEPLAPLVPRTDSVPAAVAGTAQLVSLGAALPPRAKGWNELVTGLLASAAVAEALTGTFPVPPTLAAADGRTLPGTEVRIEVAREPRTLAEWSAYMGNCIAGDDYLDAAHAGRSILIALRDPVGTILANVEVRPTAHGWRIAELQGRFNREADPEVAQRLRQWIATVPVGRPPSASAQPPVRDHAGRRGAQSPARRLVREVGEPLAAGAARVLADPETVRAAATLAALTSGTAALPALTALRRAAQARLTEAVRDALDSGAGDLAELWTATAVRPLATALAGLDPALRQRFDQLDRLLDDAPLLGSLRTIARRPGVAPARSMDLVAHRLRVAIGRLARTGDPVLARAIAQRPTTGMLCALVLVVNSGGADLPMTPVAQPRAGTVPGFPASSLTDMDGPWVRAWPDAEEVGCVRADFWRRIASDGLHVPTAWLGPGGWPALWQRAAR
jgi:hypothetical protein